MSYISLSDGGLRLLLNTNRKSYMTFKMVTFNLTLRDLERSNSRSRIFKRPISHYWMWLALGYYWTVIGSYIWPSKWWPSIWPCVTLKLQTQGRGYFNVLYLSMGWSSLLAGTEGLQLLLVTMIKVTLSVNLQDPWSYFWIWRFWLFGGHFWSI